MAVLSIDRALEDGLRIYRRYFEVCRVLGIPRVVFHGDYRQTPFPFQRHCENYLLLRRTAREYGVDFCQENVVRCKCRNMCVKCGNIRGTMSHLFWM